MRARRLGLMPARGAVGMGAALLLLCTPALPATAGETSAGSTPVRASNDRSAWHGKGHGKRLGLRDVAPRGFFVGTAAAGGGHHLEQDYPDPFTYDRTYRRILAAEFNSVTPENQMKWDFIHPEPDVYNFGPTDAIVTFARRHHQVVRGHTLLWHNQLPAWVRDGDFTDAELRAVLKDHIKTVVGRYRGRIQQWDVANEIFTDGENPQLRSENIFIQRLGPGIIADAFRWAHQADPKAELFLNDYAVEDIGPKSTAYYELAKQLRAQGVPLHGFAVQAHLSFEYPFPATLRQNLQRFDDLGLETAVTELDVRMPVAASGPTPQQLAQQADWYRWTLQACLAVEDCNSFTIWGFTDKYSWVPHFFAGFGAANVMTENFERKPAYYALWHTLARARSHHGAT
jgi:endo-1,4-beta-xylanase